MIPATLRHAHLAALLSPITTLLADPGVDEIMINGPHEVWVERAGRIESTDARFESAEDLLAALRAVAQSVGRPLDDAHPILEGCLPDGSRLEAVLAPIVARGPTVCIRRFTPHRLDLGALTRNGTLWPAAEAALTAAVDGKRNVLVSGGTGSGKTSLLNALSAHVDADERIIVLEDTRELRLARPHVVQLEARPPDARGGGAITVRALLRATLRLRPDRIVLGEIRGAEALDLIQAMTSGHGGCLATIHASHPCDALARLETLALMNDTALPLSALRAQIASAVDLVVQVARTRDGHRRVTEITTVEGLEACGDYAFGERLTRKHP